MKQEQDSFINTLRAHDPATIDGARLERFHAALAARLNEPRPAPQAKRAFPWRLRLFPFAPQLSLGLAALLLGLFLGGELAVSTVTQGTGRGTGEAKLSVLAMAEPWQDFITEGE